MGTASSIVKSPVVEKIVTLTLQTPNVLALMDIDGQASAVYQVLCC
jgi:hypothetical protein